MGCGRARCRQRRAQEHRQRKTSLGQRAEWQRGGMVRRTLHIVERLESRVAVQRVGVATASLVLEREQGEGVECQ